MALLIPAFVDERTPPGERDIFARLTACPEDWIALHALDLAPWNRGLRTEIDFLLIVPDLGILCIEVKSHEEIRFDGQRWHPDSIKRSPFKQALDASKTFARRVKDHMPSLRDVPVVHLCAFPNARFDVQTNISINRPEYIDSDEMEALDGAADFASLIRTKLRLGIELDRTLRGLTKPLSRPQMDEIVRFCTPVERRRPSAAEEIARKSQEMDRLLRVQQFPVLSLTRSNPRVIVTGPAGTGKTLISMEVARRAALDGQRVALLCHNQLIGDWIAERIRSDKTLPPTLVAGRAIKVMSEMTNVPIPPNSSSAFWDSELPELLEDKLTDADFAALAQFDLLVLDEAQDLMARPSLWACLELFLKGGFSDGAFAVFGDFEHQVLTGGDTARETLENLIASARPARWALDENCRNYQSVGQAATSLSGCRERLYSGYLRSGGGARSYDIDFYEDEEQQLNILKAWLHDFKVLGFRPSDVSVLSFSRDEFSAAGQLRSAGIPLAPAWQRSDRHTSFASVHAFKGMENKAVILTDVSLNDQDFKRALFYTGATRATECMRILCHASSAPVISQWLKE
ncbi:NERD domain-containing protein [Variovorax sp. 350MFTsu5.1]|uniref:nuclease-related domain-containing DEAD/DEAH box helicase n=1 Tax=Variovorax sp. 350MFTsu5.1 TaxID=3158365 RepID=UPI003AB09001